MTQNQHHGSEVKVFFAIYLLISAAVGSAIFFLMRADNKVDLALLNEKTVSVDPTEKKPIEKPPDPKPEPKPDVPKPKPEEPKEPEEEKPKPPVPPPEAKPEPEKNTLTPAELAQIEELFPFPEIKPLLEIVNNWQDVPKSAYPKMVAIRKPVEFELTQGGQTVARGKLPIGSMMIPLTLRSDQLTLKTAGSAPITVTIPVEDTDFKELIESRYASFIETRNAQVLAQRNAERDRRLGAIALEQSLTEWNDGSDPRFDPVKASLQRGDAGIYSLADATKWRWGGTEEIDETEYETVFVLIVSEAAFGVTELELKVLIQGGKVAHWLNPATGEEI